MPPPLPVPPPPLPPPSSSAVRKKKYHKKRLSARMKTLSHEYARAITLSQCDLYTGGGVRWGKHMFANKRASFFPLLISSSPLFIYLAGVVKVPAAVVYGDPAALREAAPPTTAKLPSPHYGDKTGERSPPPPPPDLTSFDLKRLFFCFVV